MNDYFPIFFNLKGKKILIVGAGAIALRRIEALLPFEPEIVVAAPDCKIEIEQYRDAGQLTFWQLEYESNLLKKNAVKWSAAKTDTICLETGALTLDSVNPNGAGRGQAGYFMIIAATNCPELNRQICDDGRNAGAFVNIASDKSQCDFYFPAIVRQGEIVAGVCASGKNHSLVRKVAADMRKWLREYMKQQR